MRKKLFAVIMSAMMMITFMPTMAFAAWTDGTYSCKVTDWKDYSEATVEFTRTTPTADTYSKNISTVRTAVVDSTTPTNLKFKGNINARVKGVATTELSAQANYFDLDAASVTEISGQALPANGRISLATAKAMFGEKFEKTVDVTKVTFGVPSYVSNAKNVWKEASGATSPDMTFADMKADFNKTQLATAGFKFQLVAPAFDSSKIYTENQSFELTVLATYDKDSNGEYVRFLGSLPTVKITVLKESKKLDNFNDSSFIYKDNFNEYYDGAEHTIEQIDVPGFTSTFELYNNKTGKYEAVDAVKVKNAGAYGIKATVKETATGNTKTIPFTRNVKKADALKYGFKTTGNVKVAGTFDPSKYVAVEYVKDTNTTATADAKNKSSKKAYAKEKAEVLKYVNEAYNIVKEDNGDGKTLCTLEKKEAKDFAAANTKYAELLANYDDCTLGLDDTATFEVVCSIDFTKAPFTKTFKAKKGKLPKNKTIQVKAKASDGRTLVYKLTKGAGKIVINKSTGKITVKKGLKKGTYKVGVHAIDINTYGQINAYGANVQIENSYTLKIKVK